MSHSPVAKGLLALPRTMVLLPAGRTTFSARLILQHRSMPLRHMVITPSPAQVILPVEKSNVIPCALRKSVPIKPAFVTSATRTSCLICCSPNCTLTRATPKTCNDDPSAETSCPTYGSSFGLSDSGILLNTPPDTIVHVQPVSTSHSSGWPSIVPRTNMPLSFVTRVWRTSPTSTFSTGSLAGPQEWSDPVAAPSSFPD